MSLESANKQLRLYTHSSSKTFRACQYQYFVSYILGIRPKKTAKPLSFGTLIHLCLEVYWLTRKVNETSTEHIDPLSMALLELEKRKKEQQNIDEFDVARAQVMLIAYASVWDHTECQVLAVEAKFLTPLFNPATMEPSKRFNRSGKIDLIIRLLEKDQPPMITVVEHKTSAANVMAGSDYQRRLTLDEQISFYYQGARHIGFPPDQVIYDVLKKFKIKPLKATSKDKLRYKKPKKGHEAEPQLYAGQRLVDETVEQYQERLTEMVKKDPQAFIERIKIVRLPYERKRFAMEVWKQSRLMEHALDEDLFPRNSDACFRFGSPCSYVQHCLENTPLDDPKVYYKLGDVHPELEDKDEDEDEAEEAVAEVSGG